MEKKKQQTTKKKQQNKKQTTKCLNTYCSNKSSQNYEYYCDDCAKELLNEGVFC